MRIARTGSHGAANVRKCPEFVRILIKRGHRAMSHFGDICLSFATLAVTRVSKSSTSSSRGNLPTFSSPASETVVSPNLKSRRLGKCCKCSTRHR